MKIKSIAAVLTLAAAFLAPSVSSGAEGIIYDIRPLEGSSMGPTTALKPGQRVRFLMRLVSRDLDTPTPARWGIVHNPESPSDWMADTNNFLKVGIIVSGRTKYATVKEIHGLEGAGKECYTDMVLEYQVEPGDIAFPIQLAMEGSTPDNPVYRSDDAPSVNYCLKNTEYWLLRDTDGNVCTDFRYCSDATASKAEVTFGKPEGERYKDMDLTKNGKFFVKGYEFVDGETDPWVTVPEGSAVRTPGVRTIGTPVEAVTLHAWAKDETSLRIPKELKETRDRKAEYVGRRVTMLQEDGSTVDHIVYDILFTTGTEERLFDLFGVGKETTTEIILSPIDHYEFNGSGKLVENYLTVTAGCREKDPPRIEVTDARYNPDVTMVATVEPEGVEMKVTFTEAFTNDVLVNLNPQVPGSAVDPLTNGYVTILLAATPNPVSATPTNAVVVKKGETEATFWVYPLGTCEDILNKGVVLKPTASDPAAAEFFSKGVPVNATLHVSDQKPEILRADLPATGFEGEEVDVEVTIVDNPRDLDRTQNTNGYAVAIQLGDARVLPLTNGVYFTSGIPQTFAVRVPASGTLEGEVRVWDPTHPSPALGNAATFPIRIVAKKARVAQAQLFDSSASDAKPLTRTEFAEGDTPYLRVVLTPKAAQDMYAFILPLDAVSSNLVDTAALTNGLEIGTTAVGTNDMTYSECLPIKLKDGDAKLPHLTKLRYSVILKDRQDFNDPAATVIDTYQSQAWDPITITNVAPGVEGVWKGTASNGVEIANGGRYSGKVPAGQPVMFTAKVFDPGELDLADTNSPIQVRWVYSDGPDGVDQSPVFSTVATNGYTTQKITFYEEGATNTVKLYARDRDMVAADPNAWGRLLYTFRIVADEAPRVIIEYPQGNEYGDFWDNGNKSANYIVVKVSDFPASTDHATGSRPIGKSNKLQIGLTIDYDYKGDHGNLNFTTNVVYIGSDDENKKGTAGKVYFDLPTQNGGDDNPTLFVVTAKVLNSDSSNQYDTAWCDYFEQTEAEIRMFNQPPTLKLGSGMAGKLFSTGTNRWAAGELITLKWTVTDTAFDLTNNRFSVAWDGVISTNNESVIQLTDWPMTTTNVAKGSSSGLFTFRVPDVELTHVTVTADDGDGGQAEESFWIQVELTKKLAVNVYGPALTTQTKYDVAPGLGKGHVYAEDGTGQSLVHQFKQTHFYSAAAKQAHLFAAGYPAAASPAYDNGGLIAGLVGVPLDSSGNAYAAGATYYDYASAYDSFFYCWAMKGASGGSGMSEEEMTALAPAPAVTPNALAERYFTLDNEKDKDGGGYGTVEVEAIFARELLVTDNMGDINADWIPDLYVKFYGLTAEAEARESSDLDSLTDVNADTGKNAAGEPVSGDFLPMVENTVLSRLIPGLPKNWTDGQAFTARLEIRGYGDGLNDATGDMFPDGVANRARIAGVAPMKVYLDPDTCRTSTLSRVEFAAWREFAAVKNIADPDDPAEWSKWSPERPTNPTVADTDGDGFPDGYEYFFWYRAHVGYFADIAEKVHRRLTGRRYDPRNPGAGKFISSEEIERLMDPIVAADTGVAKTRDTDNDGLPDLLEFELGTNPFDFDTDGDGLPDGFEILLGGTDPLNAYTQPNKCDAMRNYDGDAMAFTTPELESGVMPPPPFVQRWTTFAVEDPKGDSDGIQWYAVRGKADFAVSVTNEPAGTAWLFRYSDDGFTWKDALSLSAEKPVCGDEEISGDGTLTNAVLLVSLPRGTAYLTVTNKAGVVRSEPVAIAAGALLQNVAQGDYNVQKLLAAVPAKKANTAWIYGSDRVSTVTDANNLNVLGGFGMLAIGRQAAGDIPAGTVLAGIASSTRPVALMHYLVYQEFGFDPRTAWNATTPLAPRWGKSVGHGTEEAGDASTETQVNVYLANAGYAGCATRTREFTMYDEFLLLSFWLNNGTIGDGDVTASTGIPWASIWSKYTTNPQGPDEPYWAEDSDHYKGRTVPNGTATMSDEEKANGADTDQDGVPDGWELYVMSGPKKGVPFKFVAPYNDRPFSYFGPFVGDANVSGNTDNKATSGDEGGSAGDYDGLTELREYAGTDSCGYYSGYDGKEGFKVWSTTIRRPGEDEKWLNKFFPTDPWNEDTDNDGVKDAEEAAAFAYNPKPADDDSYMIPGAGLNPLTVDTDQDGLPDYWEKAFAGSFVAADAENLPEGKNPANGITNGMDGTVADAVTKPSGVNRDYDRDGLENWQEYMTGTMRCWRYDDPYSSWSYIPGDVYSPGGAFDAKAAAQRLFDAGLLEQNTEEAFWYNTVFNPQSRIYNPYLVTGTSNGGQYFTRVSRTWDICYLDDELTKGKFAGGAYYWLPPIVADRSIKDMWGNEMKKPPSCSPLKSDTDQDGMDDYSELFHGLNPLLGGPATGGSSALDVVAGSMKLYWYDYNTWWEGVVGQPRSDGAAPRGTGYDFEIFPWLNGLATADPDGDDVRNQIEAVMPKLATPTWLHTDPSPLWMTDASYSNSLTRMFYRLPRRSDSVVPLTTVTDENGDTVPGVEYTYKDAEGKDKTVKRYFRDAPGFVGTMFTNFIPDHWKLSASEKYYDNFMYSFEENEGYDTDHDAIGDSEETGGKLRTASDPQHFDSPHRRQAMYFPGLDSALQTPPFLEEYHPVATYPWPDEQTFLTFTVECWVRPEDVSAVRPQTIVERAIWSTDSNAGDEEFIRKNFQLAIRNGKWYAKYDSNGTLGGNPVEVYSLADATAEWHHLAATYDGENLTLYVDGEKANAQPSHLQPEYGSSAVATSHRAETAGEYLFDMEYAYHAFLVGAAFKGTSQGGAGLALDVTLGVGWNAYHEFFKGYVDEVRVWDGARSATQIRDAKDVRFTSELAQENRNTFYSQWIKGYRRYSKDPYGFYAQMEPELRFHWSFDSVPGAADAATVAVVPHGFDYYQPDMAGGTPKGKAVLSRPEGYQIAWWKAILDAYGSVYAGATNWVTWIPNTVAHLPRFDGTTLDSMFWSDTYAGGVSGTYDFPRTAEPVSYWRQFEYLGDIKGGDYCSTGTRHHFIEELTGLVDDSDTNAVRSTQMNQFLFTGRNLHQLGDDLLPLGGAFVKSCEEMWDGQGASTAWEVTSVDSDNDGLPDAWEAYARENYAARGFDPEVDDLNAKTTVLYHGREMEAGEAFKRDLAAGLVVVAEEDGSPTVAQTPFVQTADEDQSRIPDWWEDLYGLPLGTGGTTDTDNDGLSNYNEYLASEVLPFGLHLDPRFASTDTVTNDYFKTVGRLYVGEMLTDYDQMEDHWERTLADEDLASTAFWDALKDGDEDGWTNFDENRYCSYKRATLAQLASHIVGTTETLDAPVPSVRMKVRYAGTNLSGDADGGTSSNAVPDLIVTSHHRDPKTGSYVQKADATWRIRPGQAMSGSVFLGGWEDRVVRGTMTPGHIDFTSVDLSFMQVLQSDLYSWSDETGIHISEPYANFKAALQRDPSIIQNVQSSEGELWARFVDAANPYGGGSSKAVTVTRDSQLQTGYIAIYGERVGTIDLETGDFELDLGAINRLTGLIGTYRETENDAWGFKEAVFRLDYKAVVPVLNAAKFDLSLAQPAEGFVRGGDNMFMAFYDLGKDGAYTPGDPFGVATGVNVGWAEAQAEIELTDMSAITPRVLLWGASAGSGSSTAPSGGKEGESTGRATADDSDRGVRVGTATFEAGDDARFEVATAPAPKSRVRVVRYKVDRFPVYKVGVEAGVVLEKDFEQQARDFLSEGDFLENGDLDIDWKNLYTDVVNWWGAQMAACEVTNVTYLIVYNWDKSEYATDDDTNTLVKANATLVTRRFEKTRTVPTACPDAAICTKAQPTFAWRIDNEDTWASWYGTTYTGFKVRVYAETAAGKRGALVYDSGIRRLPAPDSTGVYRWTAPLYVGEKSPTGQAFDNLKKYQWDVAVYNAKFKTDTLYEMERNDATGARVFSKSETFRMNVTTVDESSFEIPLKVCYSGPAKVLADKVRVQAFASPDFTGDPAAELTLEDVSSVALAPTVDAAHDLGNVKLAGLPAGTWFLRAYIDTNGNRRHDDWESWGYLNERDIADVKGIFNPVGLAVGTGVRTPSVRRLYIEDCDTDGDFFPDVWEAEQNGNVFDRTKISPVAGDAEMIKVNPNLTNTLSAGATLASSLPRALNALRSPAGVSLMTGIDPADVEVADGGFEVKSEVDPETLTIVGFDIDAAQNRVLLKVGAETTANVDAAVANFLNIRVQKGAEVTVKVESAKSPAGPWTVVPGVNGTVTVDRAGADIEVNLTGELPAQGYFRAKIEE